MSGFQIDSSDDNQQQKSSTLVDHDIELFGRSFREQNEIISERLTMLETEKLLMDKIRGKLLEELEAYQNRGNPEVEANALERLYESGKLNMKKVEVQLNAEVSRLQKVFYDSWMKLLMAKQKYDVNDWEIRTKYMPLLHNLHQKFFEKQEKLSKVQRETEEVKIELEQKALVNNQMEEDIEKFEEDLMETFNKIELEVSETSNLKHEIKQIHHQLKSIKAKREKSVNEMKENFAVHERIKEIHKENLQTKLNETRENTEKGIAGRDCIIAGLTETIILETCEIQKAKLLIEKLEMDVKYLQGKGRREVVGRDYLGSNFVKIKVD
jgi:chromosome segregation ATPase